MLALAALAATPPQGAFLVRIMGSLDSAIGLAPGMTPSQRGHPCIHTLAVGK